MSKVAELFGHATTSNQNWKDVVAKSSCPFLGRLCLKNRKSDPATLIGTCTVNYGREERPVIICPHRLLERQQIFIDCFHLLSLHEPGNEIHIVPEIAVPGGSVDYVVTSVHKKKVKDFVGIELQTLDTTGTVWPERQRFLKSKGLQVFRRDVDCPDSFGMNWKMTAKTILVQLHHKVETFENVNKHLVLVVQNWLLDYVQANFAFEHIKEARVGDSMHIHAYQFDKRAGRLRLQLSKRLSTDAEGVGRSLGLQVSAKVELKAIVEMLEAKISDSTLFRVGGRIGSVACGTQPS